MSELDDVLEPSPPAEDELADVGRATLMRVVALQHEVCHLRKSHGRLEKIVRGNDGMGGGLVVRVDRLEQTEKRRRWLERTWIVTLLGLGGLGVAAVVRRMWAK